MAKAGSNRRGLGGRSRSPAPGAARPSRFEFVIPSVDADAREAERQILDDVLRRKYNEHSVFAIRLAIEEALMNAIRHGNGRDPQKKIRITATITSKKAEIVIEDEGSGFDRTGVPDPTLDENLCKVTGRGILLIEAYMSKVQWSRNGRRLRMVRRNEADTPLRK
jgi:serine/threonine-protein kinase RsbW